MSRVFRAKLVEELTKQVPIPSTIRKQMFARNWVVYAKQSFGGAGQVMEYLGR
jgi:hypothetical protein